MAVVIGQDLLHEKSLWQIYRQCVRVLPPSKFNIASSAVFLFALICDVAYFPSNYQYRIESARSMADIGLGFGSTVLGFLIAGFTIFSTLTRPDLFRRLYEKTHTPSGLSYLKVNFFTFAEVFVVYAFLLIICGGKNIRIKSSKCVLPGSDMARQFGMGFIFSLTTLQPVSIEVFHLQYLSYSNDLNSLVV
jgi:hypothetical protein